MKQVTEYIWRGPRPRDIRQLVEMGFKRVISLQSGAEDTLKDTKYEVQSHVAELYGIEMIKIECSNILPPNAEQVTLAHCLMLDDVKTYVHCHSGVDRTGFIIETFLMLYKGKPFAHAHADWIAEGRHWWFFWWKSALKKWRGLAG
jgi:protein tyrosine phosphatase (PTP) superfamily phosphohydrolase (DUF442 family)